MFYEDKLKLHKKCYNQSTLNVTEHALSYITRPILGERTLAFTVTDLSAISLASGHHCLILYTESKPSTRYSGIIHFCTF